MNLRANPQIWDDLGTYTFFDTSSPLDMEFGAFMMDAVNELENTTHACGKIRNDLLLANGLACNPSTFSNQTCFRVFVDLTTSPNPHINRG